MDDRLEAIIAINDTTAIEDYLRAEMLLDKENLHSRYLAVVRKTKNYAALPLLESFFPDDDDEEFSALLADAVKDNTISVLQKYLPVKPAWVSFACGKAEVDLDLIPESFRDAWRYFEGIIATDNLELFLKYRSIFNGDTAYILSSASEYCARKIITHCGFSANNIALCVMHAFRSCNKDTLLFLRDQEDPYIEDQFEGVLFWFLHSRRKEDIQYSFLVDCFDSKLITLKKEGWNKLCIMHPELYNMLQEDV